MSFAPVPPTIRLEPQRIAADTWLVRSVQPALGAPLFVQLNSMVIRGAEPVVVDTGTVANRAQWLEDVFSIVEPEDVRWVFVSHDDIDHTGNLDEVMSACPNARLVCSWALVERHTNAFAFPLERCRWVSDGEILDVGDRTLLAVRPPVYDSPTTRGLFDPTTGVYWAVDSFATPLPDADADVAELDAEIWAAGLAMFALNAVGPWVSAADPDKFGRLVDRVQGLGVTAVASAHSPVVRGPSLDIAFARMRELPLLEPPSVPDQSVLDQIVEATALPRA